MRVRLDYGSDGLEVDLPDDRITVIEPRHEPALADPAHGARRGPGRPDRTPPLARRRPRRPARGHLGLRHHPRPAAPRDARGAVRGDAGGAPRGRDDPRSPPARTAPTPPPSSSRCSARDDRRALPRGQPRRRDDSALAFVGRTSTGVPVWLNRDWLDADVRITTGFVEPHFFAGFSGGPKMVAPGLAGLETVLALHDAAAHRPSERDVGHHRGQPDPRRRARDRADGRRALRRSTSRSTASRRSPRVFAGDLFAEHAAACAHVKQHGDARRSPRRSTSC